MFVSKIEGLVLHKKKITQLNTSLYCLKCRKSALESFESEIDTEQEKKKQKKLRIFRQALFCSKHLTLAKHLALSIQTQKSITWGRCVKPVQTTSPFVLLFKSHGRKGRENKKP